MLPGMTAKALIRIEGVDNALLIPEKALRQTRDSSFVYTTYDPATGTLGAYENAWATRGKGAGKTGAVLGWLPIPLMNRLTPSSTFSPPIAPQTSPAAMMDR